MLLSTGDLVRCPASPLLEHQGLNTGTVRTVGTLLQSLSDLQVQESPPSSDLAGDMRQLWLLLLYEVKLSRLVRSAARSLTSPTVRGKFSQPGGASHLHRPTRLSRRLSRLTVTRPDISADWLELVHSCRHSLQDSLTSHLVREGSKNNSKLEKFLSQQVLPILLSVK